MYQLPATPCHSHILPVLSRPQSFSVSWESPSKERSAAWCSMYQNSNLTPMHTPSHNEHLISVLSGNAASQCKKSIYEAVYIVSVYLYRKQVRWESWAVAGVRCLSLSIAATLPLTSQFPVYLLSRYFQAVFSSSSNLSQWKLTATAWKQG